MLTNRTLTEEQTRIRRAFTDFFESERYEEKYHRRIQAMIAASKARLIMDMGDLIDTPLEEFEISDNALSGRSAPTSLGMGLIQDPGKFIPLLELSVHDVVLRQQPEYLKVDYRSRAVHVGFEGPVGTVLSPRELYARHLNTLVALEGIITRQSTNRPRVLETVHYCPETNKFTKKEFRDQLTPMIDSSHLPTVNVMPKTDMEGHILRTELGLSTFMDSQCAILQEAPECAPTGQLPRHVEVRFDDDLVDNVKPGDRVVLVGVFMPYTTADSKSFQSIVLINHIAPTQAASRLARFLPSVEDKLVAFAQKCIQQEGPSGVLKTLAKAVAPSIYGMTNEKRAVLLLMVGGVERQAHNTHIRGDINVLLVGEPSTAKSQLLRFVLGVSPLALSTTGKGSSGVGLTAAVSSDPYTGERSLSAGAMVLADRGILCIDEFDKMGAPDRVAMHEAMEQQTVTIAKAGIHASLNARCSVLAAANPIYGFYSVHHRLAFNVGLPESLLSRFDLTFIILDQHSSSHNRRIANHILRNHMTSNPVNLDPVATKTIVDGVDQPTNADGNNGADDSSANSFDGMGGGNRLSGAGGGLDMRMTTNSTGESIVSVDFLRAYVQMCRSGNPLLTEASQQLVSQHYVQLRAEQQDGTKDGFFVTARTLEAIIRLSTAHAKLRLSPTVEEDDVMAAMELLRASVNAATSATMQRDEDNRTARAEVEEQEAGPSNNRKRGADALGNEPAAEAGPTRGGLRMEDTTPRRRTAATTDPLMEEGNPSVALSKQIIEVLKGYQREQRSSVKLDELWNKLGSSQTVSLDELQKKVTELQGDVFIYESSADGGEDTLQFL